MARRTVQVGRVLVGVAFFGGWELYGRFVDATWVSMPSQIIERLYQMGVLDILGNTATTVLEMVIGLLIGVPAGALLGLIFGRMPRTEALFRPFLIAGNSIPLPALAPLFILWFGLGIAPKVVLVALVTFFLMFFTALSGARNVDRDWIDMLALMGSSRAEVFRKIIGPAAVAWIFSGLKNALPYALIAATVGEILLSRRGLGFLISNAASNFDMTGLYTALVLLIVLGALLNEALAWTQRHWMRWRA